MLATNSDGVAFSQVFADAAASPVVGYDCRLFRDGADLGATIRRLSLSIGAGDGADGAYPGMVQSWAMQAALAECGPLPVGTALEVRVGVEVAEGSYEYATVAVVDVTEVRRRPREVEVTAEGPLATRMAEATAGLAEGRHSASAIAAAVATSSGVPVALGAFASASAGVLVEGAMPCRNALARLALALGGFVTEVGGSVVVAPFPRVATCAASEEQMTSSPSLDEADYVVDGLSVSVPTLDDGAPGPVYAHGTGRVVVADPGATAETAAMAWANIGGTAYRAGTLTFSVLDPRLTTLDAMSVDAEGATALVPALSISATYDGGWFGSVSAPGMLEDAQGADGPLATKVNVLRTAMLSADRALIDRMYVNEARVGDLQAATADLATVRADSAKVHDLTAAAIEAATAHVAQLTAQGLTAEVIAADHATLGSVGATYARIDAANIGTATARDAWVDALMVQSGLIAHEGTVYSLDAIQVNADNVTAGTIAVERLLVTDADGERYLVSAEDGQPTYRKLDGNVLEDLTVTADKIVAGAVTAEKITAEDIAGAGGWINLRSGTFAYQNAATGHGIAWDGERLAISGEVNVGDSTMALADVAALAARPNAPDVVGAAEWAAAHGEMAATADTSAQEGKWYFSRTGEGTDESPWAYSVAAVPAGGDPCALGLYELASVGESLRDYLEGHVGMLADGLEVKAGGSSYRMVLASDGWRLADGSGNDVAGLVARDGGAMQHVGRLDQMHLEVTGSRLAFVTGDGTEVAYVTADNGGELQIARAIVLERLRMGQWEWRERPNGNLALFWIGG